MIRILAILLFLFILVNLFLALKAMITDKSGSTNTVKALTKRVVASIVLFIFIIGITLLTQ